MNVRRRDLLAGSALTLAGATLAPRLTHAQTPKRGGTLTLRTYDPPHFDPFLTVSFKTHIALSFVYVAVWENAVKNYAPNLGYDYGGRLMAAWLDR